MGTSAGEDGRNGREDALGKGRHIMDKELYERVGAWFEEHQEQMKKDIMRLVRIPSISVPWGPGDDLGRKDVLEPSRPCRDCLEEMLAIGREHGFFTENYGNKVGSIGEREKDWDNMIGFWNHMDVVPVGNQWKYEPFAPVVEENFLIGRGSQDNKGPAVGILYMMECLRELGVPLKHQLCLFVGTDEERAMEDIEYYIKHYPAPRLSMVADSGFPVCYGEKGIMEGEMRCQRPLWEGILEMGGGSASNMIPDMAYAVLKRTDMTENAVNAALDILAGVRKPGETAQNRAESKETKDTLAGAGKPAERDGLRESRAEIEAVFERDVIRIISKGRSKHSAFPQGSVNAVHGLMGFLAGVESLPSEDAELFGRLAFLSEEYFGEHMGIAYEDQVSGRTICAATMLKLEGRRIFLQYNIRYAITADQEEIQRNLCKAGEENGMVWELWRNSKPNYFPREHPAVERLTRLYNEITGSQAESFVMGGGTYARMLPRAFAYGIGAMKESEEDREARRKLFPPGHGGAHEPDEGINLRLLTEAMKIYAMAMVELNDCRI